MSYNELVYCWLARAGNGGGLFLAGIGGKFAGFRCGIGGIFCGIGAGGLAASGFCWDVGDCWLFNIGADSFGGSCGD